MIKTQNNEYRLTKIFFVLNFEINLLSNKRFIKKNLKIISTIANYTYIIKKNRNS